MDKKNHFKSIILGCSGGPVENNLSGYLLAPVDSSKYVALDAGSLLEGIYAAKTKGSLNVQENEFLRNNVTAYLISHPHLDHVRGLILNSPIDSCKDIYGIDFTINAIRDGLFNGHIWPNFGSEGIKPIGKYTYHRLLLEAAISIPHVSMEMESFLLSHPNGYPSTAFLLKSSDAYMLYCGDTAPDSLEKEKRLEKIWRRVAPLIREQQLKGIFIECSYDQSHDINELYGHLTPYFLTEELNKLAALVNPAAPLTALSLSSLKVVVTHIKNFHVGDRLAQEKIREELLRMNTLGVHYIFPEQGQRIDF